ncbi:MAG: hypothetical protein GX364_07680 [Firmicutes bacterium]|jgi:hypothetical protein|nr:hypothetical protein [Bacillota bacterium]
MNERKIFWGLFLIIAGITLGLSSFGVIEWGFWCFFLPRFWPVLLIALGIFIISGRNRFSLGLVLLIIAGTVVAGIWLWDNHDCKKRGKHFISGEEMLALPTGIDVANLELAFGAGSLRMGGNNERRLEIMYSGDISGPEIKSNFRENKAEYLVKQTSGSFPRFSSEILNGEWNVRLPRSVAWDLDLELGATGADLDFREIDLKSLDLEIGAGNITIRLGERGMETRLSIDAGASRVKVIVPDSMELDIELDGGLVSSNLEDQGLTRKGNHYVTEDVSSSRMTLNFSGGASRFELERHPPSIQS